MDQLLNRGLQQLRAVLRALAVVRFPPTTSYLMVAGILALCMSWEPGSVQAKTALTHDYAKHSIHRQNTPRQQMTEHPAPQHAPLHPVSVHPASLHATNQHAPPHPATHPASSAHEKRYGFLHLQHSRTGNE